MKKVLFAAMMTAIIFGFGFVASACDVNGGKKIFDKNCAPCHGKEGKATMAKVPDFSKGERIDKTDLQLANSINKGVAGTMMPAWEGKLKSAEVGDVLCYIRDLSGSAMKKTDSKDSDNKKPVAKSAGKKKSSKRKTQK